MVEQAKRDGLFNLTTEIPLLTGVVCRINSNLPRGSQILDSSRCVITSLGGGQYSAASSSSPSRLSLATSS